MEDQDVLWAIRMAGQRNEEGLRRSALVETLVHTIAEKNPGKQFPSPTEYYVAILSTLATHITSQRSNENATSAQAVTLSGDLLYLLSKVVPHLPIAVARLDSEAALASMVASTKMCNNLGARSGLSALGSLLALQPKDAWSRPIISKSFRACLSRVTDDNPKVRRAAQESVLQVMTKQSDVAGPNSALSVCLEVVEAALGSRGTSDRNVLKMLHFCRQLAPHLATHKKQLHSVFETLVRLVEGTTDREVFSQTVRTLSEYFRALRGDQSDTMEDEAYEELAEASMKRLIHCFNFNNFPVEPWGDALVALSEGSAARHIAVKAILAVIRDEQAHIKETAAANGGLGYLAYESLARIVSASTMSKNEALESCAAYMMMILLPQMQTTWNLVLPSFVRLIDVNLDGDDDTRMLKEITKKVVEFRESLVDWKTGEEKTDAVWKHAIEDVVRCCACKLGPDAFLSVAPLFISNDNQNFNPARVCLLPILKEAWRNPSTDAVRLATFKTSILRLAKFCEDSASEAQSQGMPLNAKMHRQRTIQLWSLLPSFCTGASDVADTFPSLGKTMAQALQDARIPELAPIVANSITALVRSCDLPKEDEYDEDDEDEGANADFIHSRYGGKSVRGRDDEEANDDEDEDEDDEEEEEALKVKVIKDDEGERKRRSLRVKSEEERERDIIILRKFTPNLLPLLLNEYDAASRENAQGGSRAQTIFFAVEALCKIADRKYLSTIFRQLVQKLLVAVNNDDTPTARALFALSSAFAPSLSSEEASILLRAIKPHIVVTSDDEEDQGRPSNDEGLQKRAYVALMALIRSHAEPLVEDGETVSWVEANREMLIDMLQHSLAQSKSNVKHTRLLCLQKLLIHPATLKDAETARGLFADLLGEVVLSFKEHNSQARSAGFALFTEMADQMDVRYQSLEEFFKMTLAGLLAHTPHMRSCTIIGICRLLALYGSRIDCTEICGDSAVACFTLFEEKSREVARSLITLCKVCAVKLDLNILRERVLVPMLKGLLPWSLDTKNRFALRIRIVMDKLVKRLGGFEEIEHTGVFPADHKLLLYIRKQHSSKKSRKDGASAGEASSFRGRRGRDNEDDDGDFRITQAGAEPVDLLDPSSLGNVAKTRKRNRGDDDDNKDDFKRDAEGRIIIPEDDDEPRQGRSRRESKKTPKGQDINAESDSEDMSIDADEDTRTQRQKQQDFANKEKQTKKKRKVEQQFGQEFKARKAGGDAKYKGMKTDPYAYIPLDHRMLNKRKKHQAVKRFVGVGRNTKKGYRSRSGSSAAGGGD